MRITYTPYKDGAAFDPQPNGGSVSQIKLYRVADRAGSAITAGPAVREAEFTYVFTVDLDDGRYWPNVTWSSDGVDSLVDRLPHVDAPPASATGLVVAPEEVAWRVGLSLPLTASQRQLLASQIRGIQGRVRAYLKRPLLPERRTLTGYAPDPRWEQDDWRAWPEVLAELDEVFTVASVTESGGAYTLVVDVGIDCANDPATEVVREYIAQGASNALRFNSDAGVGSRPPASVSTGDQSVSFHAGGGGAQAFGGTFDRSSMTAGSPLVLDDLSLFRRRTAIQSGRWVPPFPYYTAVSTTRAR